MLKLKAYYAAATDVQCAQFTGTLSVGPSSTNLIGSQTVKVLFGADVDRQIQLTRYSAAFQNEAADRTGPPLPARGRYDRTVTSTVWETHFGGGGDDQPVIPPSQALERALPDCRLPPGRAAARTTSSAPACCWRAPVWHYRGMRG